LRTAKRVFFPTPRFEYLFHALKIPTFPSHASYVFQRSRLSQEILFSYLGSPHPNTRIYYGKRQKQRILRDFSLPVVAMGPKASIHGRHLIQDRHQLECSAERYNPLIIQETVEWEQRIRMLCIDFECLGAVAARRGLPEQGMNEWVECERSAYGNPLAPTIELTRRLDLNDVVVEWGRTSGFWQIIEILRPPARWPAPNGSFDRHRHICRMICEGRFEPRLRHGT
jgi:hypothetical protein